MAYSTLGTITTNAGGSWYKYIGPGNTYNANQSFKPSLSGTNRVNAFQWYGKTSGTVNVYLKNSSGTTLGSTTTNSGTTGWHSISFGYITVSPTSTYYLVFAPQSGAYIWMYHTNVNTYGDGGAYVGSGTSIAGSAEGDDYAIKITCYKYYTTASVGGTTTSSVGETSFSASSSVSNDGNASITERGFCYSTSDTTPDTGDSKKIVSGTTGAMSATISSLTADTTYYIRGYATNAAGTGYGSVATVTTDVNPPSVTTSGPSSVDVRSATLGGNVTDDHGAAVTERGVVYNTTGTPTTAHTKNTNGTGEGAFSESISGLTPNTTYYVRAYAINSEGTSYGAQYSFTTLQGEPEVTTSSTISSITTSGATLNGNVTDDNGSTITERGFVYDTSTGPTTSDLKKTVTGTTGAFSGTLTSLATGTLYYFRAFATNGEGTSYGDEYTFTTLPGDPSGLSVTVNDKDEIALAWTKGTAGTYSIVRRQAGSPPANAESGTLVYSSTGSSYTDTGLTAGTHYYYRVWASTNNTSTYNVSTNYSADDDTTIADFANPSNAQADDANYATITTSDGKLSCKVSFDGGTTWSNKRTLTFTATIETLSFGDGTTELWDTSPTGADITDANLRIKFYDDTGELSYQTYKTFGFSITSTYLLTGLEVKVKAAYDGSDLLLYFVKADPYYGTSALPIGEGSLAYDSTEKIPTYYNGTSWEKIMTGNSFVWSGPWTTATAYAIGDTVESNGSGFVCTVAHTSASATEPDVGASWTSYWDLFVEGANYDDEDWSTPTLLNSWVNYSSTYNPAGYYKKGDRVFLRGLVKSGTVATGSTGVIFTLPAGYRPAKTEIIATISNSALGQCRVDISGNVYAYTGNNAWFCLDNLSFRIA